MPKSPDSPFPIGFDYMDDHAWEFPLDYARREWGEEQAAIYEREARELLGDEAVDRGIGRIALKRPASRVESPTDDPAATPSPVESSSARSA